MYTFHGCSGGFAVRSTWLAGLVSGNDYWDLATKIQRCCELPAAGFPDEEPYTAAVLGLLRSIGTQHLRGPGGIGTGHKVAFYPRVTSKTCEEPRTGADVAIVIEIRTPQLTTTTGHLVQVKLIKDGRFTVKRSQIDKLRERDTTSTHWLIHDSDADPSHRTISVLPTDFAHARLGAGNATVGLSEQEIGVQALPFGAYVVGDLLGLWLGAPSALSEALVPGLQPAFVLGVVVTTGAVDPTEPGWLLESGQPLTFLPQ